MKRPAAAMGASRSIHIPQWVAESAAMHIPPENWPPAPISTTRRQYVQTFGYPGIPTDQQERFLQQKREEQTTSGASAPAPIVGHGLWVRDPHDPPDDAEGLARIGFLTKCDVCRNPVLPNGTRCFRFFGVPYYFHFNCLASNAGQQILADMRRASEV